MHYWFNSRTGGRVWTEDDLPALWGFEWVDGQKSYFHVDAPAKKSFVKPQPADEIKAPEQAASSNAIPPNPFSNQQETSVKQPAKQAEPLQAKQPAKPRKSGGLLGNLLGSMSSSRPQGSPAKKRASASETPEQMYKRQVKEALQKFIADTSRVSLPFAVKGNYPDEIQTYRYIVHEAVEDFDSLVSVTSEGEDGGQVVAYKNGHQPETEDSYDADVAAAAAAAAADASVQRATAKTYKTGDQLQEAAAKAAAIDMVKAGVGELQVLNKRKRDLRSIEQVLLIGCTVAFPPFCCAINRLYY
jgi:hypothetical protein